MASRFLATGAGMIRAPLEEVEKVVGRLLDDPLAPAAAATEGMVIERAERAAQRLGARVVVTAPPGDELGAVIATALRRGPVLVADLERGELAGLASHEMPPSAQLRAWQGRDGDLEPGIKTLLAKAGPAHHIRADRHLAGLGEAEPLPRCAVVAFEKAGTGRGRGIARRLGLALLLDLAVVGLWIAIWWVLGAVAFSGREQTGYLGAWTFLVFLRVLLAATSGWLRATAFQELAEDWRRRIFGRLSGRQAGLAGDTGELSGGLAEIEQVEDPTRQGALGVVLGLFELGFAIAILQGGAVPLVVLVVVTLALAQLGWLGWRLFGTTARWSEARVAATRGALARLDRHRSRLVFGDSPRESRQEDDELASYHRASRDIDEAALLAANLPYRFTLTLGVAALVPAAAAAAPREAIAVTVLGALLAAAAVGRLADALLALAVANAAGRRLRTLLGGTAEELGPTTDGLNFAPPRPAHRLEWGGFELAWGDKRRAPEDAVAATDEGLASRLDGIPGSVIGDQDLSRRLIAAPAAAKEQLFSASLAFNLLAARAWPPTAADLDAAVGLCRRLGLGPLVETGQGLAQAIGQGGRPLSDGEAARVLLARALLRQPDFLILRDPLAPLDPGLRAAVQEVLAAEPAGILILQSAEAAHQAD